MHFQNDFLGKSHNKQAEKILTRRKKLLALWIFLFCLPWLDVSTSCTTVKEDRGTFQPQTISQKNGFLHRSIDLFSASL